MVDTQQRGDAPPTLVQAGQAVGQSVRSLAPAVEAMAQELGIFLTDWQRRIVEQLFHAQFVTARLTGFRPLVNRRGAAVLREHGYREGEDFLLYADSPADPGADADDMPTDPMQRALWLKKRRNTGPGPDRLDGRRRRRP